jgi:nucleoside-diphosphate-sugar epimerase
MSNVLVTGGAGYVGHVLVPRLLAKGHSVTVYDTMWFGCKLAAAPRLRIITGDIRDTDHLTKALRSQNIVLHLACISNDASFELDENLSKTINYDCFESLVMAAKWAGVERFIYCSSSSVYGVSDALDVTEDHPLVPLTAYNKYKGLCEPLLFKHIDQGFCGIVIRPATLCGYSPRQRLDLSVNILTNWAANRSIINVFGGNQMRPNLHIQDMVDAYLLLLDAPRRLVQGQIFNIGAANLTIRDIADTVRNIVEARTMVPVKIATRPSNDPRSYHVNSDKIARVLGFKPRHNIEDAVRDLVLAFNKGLLPNSFDDDQYYNVRTMKALGIK